MSEDKILVFNISGKFAHFRKFYTNSSSLTYIIPPRTVVMGILGSILEKSRDEYYTLFSPDKCKLSVSLKSKVKKHFESLNYLHKNAHTQIPLELLVPLNKNDSLRYNIYVYHKNNHIIEELKTRIENNITGYGIYLGQRQFRAYFDGLVLLSDYEYISGPINSEITTVTWADNIELDFKQPFELERFKILSNYKKINSGREPDNMIEIIYPVKNSTSGKFKEIIKLKYNNEMISFFTPFKDV